nr:hypothetical protein [Planctomycetota bacterium]
MEVHALRLIQPNGVTSLVTVRIAEPRPHDGVSICDVQLAGLRPHPALIRGSSPQAARIRARAWCEQALRDEQQRGARLVQALVHRPAHGAVVLERFQRFERQRIDGVAADELLN